MNELGFSSLDHHINVIKVIEKNYLIKLFYLATLLKSTKYVSKLKNKYVYLNKAKVYEIFEKNIHKNDIMAKCSIELK